ncbi:MAG TPA: serine/threonine-protein kinase [Gemmatimonadales bacterium]|jgi:serine/threonine-protein kinase
MSTDLLAGLQEHLGSRYSLREEVGHGGMAKVYRAEDRIRGRDVAIKVFRPELAAALGRERFLREIRILGRLQHANILPLLDSGGGGGSLYFIAPYIAGSLQRRLEQHGPLPLAEVTAIARDVAAALDHACQHDVIHRDVKPGNVLLDEGRGVVCDFGVARALEVAGGERLSSSSGFAIGTPAYMSPEQALGGEVDARTDVYGLGCVLYEMLIGEPPFAGPTPQAILARSLSGEVRPLRTIRPEVPAVMEAAIKAALESDRDRRPSTAGELLGRLEGG